MPASFNAKTSSELQSRSNKINSKLGPSLVAFKPERCTNSAHEFELINLIEAVEFESLLGSSINRICDEVKATGDDANLGGSFYEEIDQRMSRNSFEYPEEQEKHVERWLNQLNSSRSQVSDSSSELGNIVGIRGFGGKSFGRSKENRQNSFNKLKCDYLELKSENEKLKRRFDEELRNFQRVSKKKDHDIEVLRAHMSSKLKQRQKCHGSKKDASRNNDEAQMSNEKSSENLEDELAEFRRKVGRDHELETETLKMENEKLKVEAAQIRSELGNEIAMLKRQLSELSADAANRLITGLRNENNRLRDITEMDRVEFETSREHYKQLVSQIEAMTGGQRLIDGERKKEVSSLMVELCRLQVYQSKLETILETERAIKQELQDRIKGVEEEKDGLEMQLKDLKLKLCQERMRTKKEDILEVECLHGELSNWQDRYHRLKKEKSDCEEMLRKTRSRLSSLDTKHKSNMDLLKANVERQLDKLRHQLIDLDGERSCLSLKLEESSKKVRELHVDNQKMARDLIEMNKRLSSQIDEETYIKKLGEKDELVAKLRRQLEVAELARRELEKEREACVMQLERSKQQVEELQLRFKHQQNAFEELKERSDKELSKLRVSLNYEKYNKQVALKGIEKELRSSLRELEAMKNRFSCRLAQANQSCPIDSANAVTTVDKANSRAKSGSGSSQARCRPSECSSTSSPSTRLSRSPAKPR